jgi:hypothetical protein
LKQGKREKKKKLRGKESERRNLLSKNAREKKLLPLRQKLSVLERLHLPKQRQRLLLISSHSQSLSKEEVEALNNHMSVVRRIRKTVLSRLSLKREQRKSLRLRKPRRLAIVR